MWMDTVVKLLVMLRSLEWLEVKRTGFTYVKKYIFLNNVNNFEKDRKRKVRKRNGHAL